MMIKRYLDLVRLTIIEKLFIVFSQKEEIETKRITCVKEEGVLVIS